MWAAYYLIACNPTVSRTNHAGLIIQIESEQSSVLSWVLVSYACMHAIT
jgi:hypothetical protein